MSTQTLTLDGHSFRADRIDLPAGSCLLTIQGSRGFLACGYVSLDAAEAFGHALAIVKGVKDFDDMLAAPVRAASSAAAALGISEGMPGRDALLRLA